MTPPTQRAIPGIRSLPVVQVGRIGRRIRSVVRVCKLLGVLLAFGVPNPSQAQDAVLDGTSQVQDFTRHFCLECHNGKKTEGELNLESTLNGHSLSTLPHDLLETLLEVIEQKEMPPRKAVKKPTDPERQQMIQRLREILHLVGKKQEGDPGLVLITRLNRTEYRHALRDLSDGIFLQAGEYLPNEGGAGEGFSNVGEAQGMNESQYEKYLEAAKSALRHLRVFPDEGLVWSPTPRDEVLAPSAARKECVDDIIHWHVTQQQKWGEEHRQHLQERLGFSHAAYLEASWDYRRQMASNSHTVTFLSIARAYEVPLAPVVLEKWFRLLNQPDPSGPLEPWARAWQKLPLNATPEAIRKSCREIVAGSTAGTPSTSGPEAPDYEISYQEAKEEVLEAARKGYWPFRIEIGGAQELYLVVTDAGDGGRGEWATWRKGRFQFRDGTARPWQDVTQVLGANSGRPFPFGLHARDQSSLPADSIGVQPPGALKLKVPPDATLLELELAVDPESLGKASIQAVILRNKPKSQAYIPGRPVFGGKTTNTPVAKADARSKEMERALEKRNVAEANLTKIGLNAERNVFASWSHTPLEAIGGPWPDHTADKEEPNYPYHLTVDQVRRNATPSDRQELERLEQRLLSIAQVPHQLALAQGRSLGWRHLKEGIPPVEATSLQTLREQVLELEIVLEGKGRSMTMDFAHRAWRRKLATSEVDSLMELYRRSREEGFSFDASVKSALMLVLSSPHFLYRGGSFPILAEEAPATQDSPGGGSMPLNSLERASRLSFFLWASIPDQELLQQASSNLLQTAEACRTQARRMLQDPRAQSLVTDFAAQLWSFGDFENFTGPDTERFPEFTREYRSQILKDLHRRLEEILLEDRPLTDLLGPQGLITHPVFMTQTSLPLRTSPVQRGVWILEKWLGRELPNPPANVPPLSEDEVSPEGLNIRQQLEKHRADASCASCHDKIDPLGIALEALDPIGRRREQDREGAPIVNVAITHDGVELHGIEGLQSYLRDRSENFLSHFNRKLLGYALGRAVQPGDQALLQKMTSGLPQEQHRFSYLVETIVTSPQFLNRRSSQRTTSIEVPGS